MSSSGTAAEEREGKMLLLDIWMWLQLHQDQSGNAAIII